MSYSVRFANGTVGTYSATTACVLAHAPLVKQLNAAAGSVIDYATPSGPDSFDVFVASSYGHPSATVALTRATMASAAAGAVVLIDDGSGRWRLGAVVGDGAQVLAPDGRPVPSTAPAAAADSANDQSLPAVGTEMQLLGTASDGKMWFAPSGQSIEAGTYVTLPVATIAALAPGSIAVVLQKTQWVVMRL